MINGEIELILTWSKNCTLADVTPANNPLTELEFKVSIQNCVLQLSLCQQKMTRNFYLEQLKSGLKRTVKLNKYRNGIKNNNKLDYLIDPTSTKFNRLFVLSFARTTRWDHRDSFSNVYLPNLQIKDFNMLIYKKSFFHLPVQNKDEAQEKIIEISRNNNEPTGNLLDFANFKENCRLIAND